MLTQPTRIIHGLVLPTSPTRALARSAAHDATVHVHPSTTTIINACTHP